MMYNSVFEKNVNVCQDLLVIPPSGFDMRKDFCWPQ